MRAVGAIGDGVLEQDSIIRIQIRLIVGVLQAKAAKLAGVEFEKPRHRTRRVAEIVERTAAERRRYVIRRKLRVTRTEAPTRRELVHRLGVPAGAREMDRYAVENAAFA